MQVQNKRRNVLELDTAQSSAIANEAASAPGGLVISVDGASLKKARRSRI